MKAPFSSRGVPGAPFSTPVMMTSVTVPDSIVTSPPSSGSQIPWPRPANSPVSGKKYVTVPIPAIVSRTQSPARRLPSDCDLAGVMTAVPRLPSLR